jgi:FlaG/FlaF family flagellin (archaellin)
VCYAVAGPVAVRLAVSVAALLAGLLAAETEVGSVTLDVTPNPAATGDLSSASAVIDWPGISTSNVAPRNGPRP